MKKLLLTLLLIVPSVAFASDWIKEGKRIENSDKSVYFDCSEGEIKIGIKILENGRFRPINSYTGRRNVLYWYRKDKGADPRSIWYVFNNEEIRPPVKKTFLKDIYESDGILDIKISADSRQGYEEIMSDSISLVGLKPLLDSILGDNLNCKQ